MNAMAVIKLSSPQVNDIEFCHKNLPLPTPFYNYMFIVL